MWKNFIKVTLRSINKNKAFPSDSSACLINEATVRKYKLEDPLNTRFLEPDLDGTNKELNVIGVIKDHHFSSLKEEIDSRIIISMPVAYFMMQDWLRGFPYNVGFQPILFASAALLAVIIALVTVTFTSLKAARTNPAAALHYE